MQQSFEDCLIEKPASAEELRDILLAISIVAKRLAKKLDKIAQQINE